MKIQTSLRQLLYIAVICCISWQCVKLKNETPKTELEKLPPITQTGANTFGCLVNGVAWLPNGRGGLYGSRIELYVDPTFQGGKFYIKGNQFTNPQSSIEVGSGNCVGSGVFPINSPSTPNVIQYYFSPPPTYFKIISSSDVTAYSFGILHITRYDLTNRIFSGTFEATLYDSTKWPDTIKITHGRFDKKL